MRAARHQAQRDSLDLVVLARLLPRPERLCRCWPNQGPFAFYRATLADRRCNRAARCGGHPILESDWTRRLAGDRYRQRRNRRGPVRCDNRSSRSRRKRAGHARPFQTSALDKCRCLLRRFADLDGQSANREWSRAARAFTPRTAATIATVNRSAPSMRAPISSENGVTAAARRAITFSNDPFFLERCAWVRTLRTSAPARQKKRKVLRPPAG